MMSIAYPDKLSIDVRLTELVSLLDAGCEAEFDAITDDLEREFQELRVQLRHFE